jgi:hypothetical protein
MSEIIRQYVTYLPNFHVIICRQCKFAIPSTYISRHFRNLHTKIPLATRQAIIDFADTVQIDEPRRVTIPHPEEDPIDDLELIKKGFQCQFGDCTECSKTEPTMRQHCRDDHGWVKSAEQMWTVQAVQTFFQGPHCKYDCVLSCSDSRYFPVTVESDPDPTLIQNLIASLLDSAKTDDDNHQRELNNVPKDSELVTLTPWLRRTRWHKTFAGRNMEQLIQLMEKPDLNDHIMFGLWRNVALVLKSCYKGVQNLEDRGWYEIPYWLAGSEMSEPDSRPFRTYFTNKSIATYMEHWQKYIIFCFRAFELDGHGIEFTPAQFTCLTELREMMYLPDPKIINEDLLKKISELSVLLIEHIDYEAERSSLIYFSGVYGYNVANCQWRQPENYTPILAGLQWCIRVLMLEKALPIDMRNDRAWITQKDPLERFKETRNYWLVEGRPTPFNYIHKLLNYGFAAGKDGTARSRVRWSKDGRVLFYEGRALKMANWGDFVLEMIDYLEDIMSEHLLFGKDGEIPAVDLHGFGVDNPMRHEAGYYFAMQKEDGMTKGRRRIIDNLFMQPKKWDKMVNMMDGEGIQLHKAAVDDYEYWVERFLEVLYIVMLITCGLPGRTKEMTSLKFVNTMNGDRNFLLEDGQFMFITEYHKSQAIMDIPKVV